MPEHRAFQLGAGEACDHRLVPTERFGYLVQQAFGDDRQALRRVNHDVFESGIEADGKVCRDGPRRRGPDQAVNFAPGQARIQGRGIGSKPEPNIDRRARVILVLDFGFGESGAVFDAPVHGLQALIDIPAVQEVDKRLGDDSLILGAHRQVWIVPAAEHSQPLEFPTMDVDEIRCIGPALGTDLRHAHRRFAFSEFLIDLELDGQPMAIPARNIGSIEARHRLRLDDEILQDFVERCPEVNVSVRVRRPVVENVLLLSLAGFPNALVKATRFPLLEQLRFEHGQVCLHWK